MMNNMVAYYNKMKRLYGNLDKVSDTTLFLKKCDLSKLFCLVKV